jgi:uncharacterized protein YndB with AHSA1/START domain
MTSTRITRHVNAPREKVYRALLDASAIAKWKVPTGMSCKVHAFDAREGGTFRIPLTYDEPTGTGKSYRPAFRLRTTKRGGARHSRSSPRSSRRLN